MYFKKLIGEKCYLSPINPMDYESYTKMVNDTEVAIGMVFASSIITMDKEKETLERLSNSGYNFAIIDKATDQLIGNVGFPNVDQINRIGEVGIFIGEKTYWGKGYGVEALQLLLDYGFNVLNLHCIYLRVYDYNEAAKKCYYKVGFKEAGRLRQAKQIAGVRYDEVYMDILEDEFESIYIKDLVYQKIKNKAKE